MHFKQVSVTVNISDMDRSVGFYQALGLNLKSRWGNFFAMLEAPGLTIGLHPTTPENIPGNSGNVSIGFSIEDLEETRNELKKLSVSFTERKEEGGEFLHFTDPDGTALYCIKSKW